MKMSATLLRINAKMIATGASCSGWSCHCPSPYGFGHGRNSICISYGPSRDAEPREVKKFQKRSSIVFRKMKMANKKLADEPLFKLAKEIARDRFLKALDRKKEDTEWHLDFEDQVRTQCFFEKRERDRAYEADAPARVRRNSWAAYQEAELESSCRSIRNLM